MLASTAARNAALSATVDALPPFLARLRSTLRVLDGTLGLAKPSLDALEPVAPLLTPGPARPDPAVGPGREAAARGARR